MTVETLGDAWRAGWRVQTRCGQGKRMGLKSIRECHRKAELDMETLVWTRGAAMPLSDLSGRLRCPACRSLRVTVAFVPPPIQDESRAAAPAAHDELTALPHRVELRRGDGSLEKLLAASADVELARGSYEAAVAKIELVGEGFLTLTHFGRAIARHPSEEPREPDEAPGAYNAEYAKMREGLPNGRRRRWK